MTGLHEGVVTATHTPVPRSLHFMEVGEVQKHHLIPVGPGLPSGTSQYATPR